jgi:replicative DNA helicase
VLWNCGSSKRPLLSDLRESGAIEQDADIVFFIVLNIIKLMNGTTMKPLATAGQAEIMIAKHRNGIRKCAIKIHWSFR